MMHKKSCSECGTDYLICDNCQSRTPEARLERVIERFERLLEAIAAQAAKSEQWASGNLNATWALAEVIENFLEKKRKGE